MIAPMIAPPIAPDADTIFARYPAHAKITLTPMAPGSAASIGAEDRPTASAVMRLASQSTAPAVAGTEMLSSRRTGIVSTIAATIVAANGAHHTHDHAGGGSTVGRVHSASAAEAT